MSGLRSTRGVHPVALVLAAVASVQFGGALAATLIPTLGAAGSVTLRLAFGAVILTLIVRPRLRGHTRRAWLTVVAFGLVLGLMNLSFYASLERLPIGVAVTVEFIGPLVLAAALSKRAADVVAVIAAGLGVVLIAGVLTTPVDDLDLVGLGLAGTAGVLWAAYIVLSARTGAEFEALDGMAICLVVATIAIAPWGVGRAIDAPGDLLLRGLAIAILSTVIPYSLELIALRQLSTGVFGVLLSLEPAVAALAGWVVLDQVLNPAQLLGMALVIAASAVVLGRRTPTSRPVRPGETSPN